MHELVASVALLAACGSPAAAPEQPLELHRVRLFGAATSPTEPPREGRYAACRWRTAVVPYAGCTGMPRPPSQAQICDACAVDADCGAGSCVAAISGGTQVRVCIAPGTPCHPDTACVGVCVLRNEETVGCEPPPPPEPICRLP